MKMKSFEFLKGIIEVPFAAFHLKTTRARYPFTSVTRLGNLLDFVQLFKAFWNN